MADRIPAGAFPEAAQIETDVARKVLGMRKKAFASRRDALVEMRQAVNEHDLDLAALQARVAALEEQPPRPFP